MKIVSFKEFNKIIDEMVVETGVNGNTFDRTNEWKTYLGSPFTKLLKDNLGTNRYKIYKYGSETYYLTDENNEYIGHIELENSKIVSSFSKLKGGFYNIMFTFILTQIPYILSDKSLSSQAIRSYEKLSNLPDKKFKLKISLDGNIKNTTNFNKDMLLSNSYARVLITEKYQNYMKNNIEDYFERINKYDKITKSPISLTKYYNERNEICDLYLFNEYISLINEGYLDLNTENILLNFLKDKIPNNKYICLWGDKSSIYAGYIDDYDNIVKFDISHIFEINNTKDKFITYFDKIPLDEREYIIYWNNKRII